MKKKVLFCSNFKTTFIEKDIEILKSFSDINIEVGGSFGSLLKKIYLIFKNDIIYIWFASFHSSIIIFIAKLLKKKTILILGGIELANIKEINYGMLNSKIKKNLIKYSIKNVNSVLAVDESLKIKAENLTKRNDIQVVPTGYDYNFWKCNQKKEKLILLVANMPDKSRFILKGADLFIQTAKLMPAFKFKIIGLRNKFETELPKNLSIEKFKNQIFLKEYYSKSKIFCQLSLSEGLPNTLCEAMLCESIPIGTNVGGINNVIGNSGFILNNRDPKELKSLILEAIKSKLGNNSRKRIISKFPLNKRINKLKRIILNYA